MSSPKDYSPQTNEDSYGVIAEFIEQQERLLEPVTESKEGGSEQYPDPDFTY
jgi:hypothetical protein